MVLFLIEHIDRKRIKNVINWKAVRKITVVSFRCFGDPLNFCFRKMKQFWDYSILFLSRLKFSNFKVESERALYKFIKKRKYWFGILKKL